MRWRWWRGERLIVGRNKRSALRHSISNSCTESCREIGRPKFDAAQCASLIAPYRLRLLRVTGRDGISRAIYVTASGRRVVILRAFVKKTQKTPPRELEIARQRAKEVQ